MLPEACLEEFVRQVVPRNNANNLSHSIDHREMSEPHGSEEVKDL